jgi:hypothetical protein
LKPVESFPESKKILSRRVVLAAALFSLCIGALYASPQVILWMQGYPLFYQAYRAEDTNSFRSDGTMPDHLFYLALIRQVADRGLPVREATTWEGSLEMPPRPHALGESILGFIFLICGGPDIFRIIVTFLFPSLIAFLFFIGSARLPGGVRVGFLSAAIATLGLYPAMLDALVRPAEVLNVTGIGPYDRFPHPMFSAVPYLITLGLLYLTGRGRRYLIWGGLTGVMIGLQFYVYHYFWTYSFVVLVLWALFLWWKGQKRRVTACVLAGLTAAIISLPYFWMLGNIPEEVRADYVLRETLAHSRALWLSTIIPPTPAAWVLHVLGFLGVWLIFKKESPQEEDKQLLPSAGWFLLILMAAAALASNQQVITGITIDPKHYYYFCFKMALAPCIAVTLLAAADYIQHRFHFRHGWMIPVAAMFALGGIVQSRYVNDFKRRSPMNMEMQQALDWLNKEASPGSVVVAAAGNSSVITIYTHNNTFLRHGKDISTQEDIDRRLAWCAVMLGVPADRLPEILEPDKVKQFFLNCTPWFFYAHLRNPQRVEQWVDSIVERRRSLEGYPGDLRCDYLLWTEEERRWSGRENPPEFLEAEQVWQSGNSCLYLLKHQPWRPDSR